MAVATLAFSACTTDLTTDNTIGVNSEKVTLEFAIEAEQTRSYMGTDLFVKFEDGDEVGVYVIPAAEGTETKNAKGTISHKDGKAVVTVEVSSFAAGDKVMAYYPYSTVNNNVAATAVLIDMHPIQVQSEAGKFNCKYMPMVSVAQTFDAASGNHLLFRPVGSVVELNLYSTNTDFEGAAIHRVVFEAQKHKDDATGGNYCSGRKAIDLTAVTEEGEIAIPASTTTAYTAPLGVVTDYAQAYRAIVDYTAEVNIPANGVKQPVYICVWPNTYGGPMYNKPESLSKIVVNTSVGNFTRELTDDLRLEYGRAMIRPLLLDLASENVKYVSTVTEDCSVEWLRENTTTDGMEWNHTLSDELIVVGSGAENDNMRRVENSAVKTQNEWVNTKTVYVQTLDGKYGFRLSFDENDANNLKRGDKIKLHLQGTSIDKSEKPNRYYITRLTPSNYTIISRGNEVVSKSRTIATLTDDDLFTDVTLQDISFVHKGGPYVYGQASMTGGKGAGHSFRAHFATMMRDANDDVIFATINAKNHWARDLEAGIQAPQGVGTLQGVLVCESDKAYGTLGKYQIRPFEAASFKMATEKAYAAKLVAGWILDKKTVSIGQYSWNDAIGAGGYKTGSATVTETLLNKLHPTYGITDGSAVLYTTNRTLMVTHTQFLGGKNNSLPNCSYFPTIIDGDKGYIKNAGHADVASSSKASALGFYHDVASYYEWDESGNWTGKTSGLIMEFPTTSVTGDMSVSFSLTPSLYARTDNKDAVTKYMFKGLLYGYPLYWKVEYSIDNGTTWTECVNAVDGSKKFKMLPMVNWLNTQDLTNPLTSTVLKGVYTNLEFCPGFTQHQFTVPAAAAGKDKVMVKISPAALRLAWFSAAAYTSTIDVSGNDCKKDYSYPHALVIEDITVTCANAK